MILYYNSRAKRGIWIWCASSTAQHHRRCLRGGFPKILGGPWRNGLRERWFYRDFGGFVTQWALRAGISTHAGGTFSGQNIPKICLGVKIGLTLDENWFWLVENDQRSELQKLGRVRTSETCNFDEFFWNFDAQKNHKNYIYIEIYIYRYIYIYIYIPF